MGWCCSSSSSSNKSTVTVHTRQQRKKKYRAREKKKNDWNSYNSDIMRKKKETVSTPQERKKKRQKHSPSETPEFSDRDERPTERKKKRLAGTVAMKKGTGSGQKGRRREEWKRLDALGAVFLSPSTFFLPTFSPGGRWLGRGGSWSVGRSAGGGGVAVAAAAVVVGGGLETTDKEGGTSLCTDLRKHGRRWCVWAVAVPRLFFPTPACSGGVANGCPVSVLPRTFVRSYQTQHLCLGAAPFSLFLPSLPQFSSSHSLSIPPSCSSFLQASQTTKVQQILSLLPSLSPPRLLATTTLRLLTRKVCRACASFCWLAWYIVFLFPSIPGRVGGRAAPPPLFRFFFLKEKMRW